MIKCSWADIRADLQRRSISTPGMDAESFRSDFKARASLMRQDPVGVPEQVGLPLLNWRLLASGAVAVLIAGMVLWPSPKTLVNQIKSLQVFSPHSGVIIMTGEAERGTVVWVTDLESDEGNKG